MKTHSALIAVAAASLFGLAGCGKSANQAVTTPKEAAVQIDQAFKEAPPETKKAAEAASEALRGGDYEKAVVSLHAMRGGKDITPEQFIATHESMVTVEAKLINAMAAGDEKAKKAYELLRQLNRN